MIVPLHAVHILIFALATINIPIVIPVVSSLAYPNLCLSLGAGTAEINNSVSL